ncbi:MAG: DUF3822 family protein [Prevotellaceae bacterium]|nr:DUF3822 family protein [Prevotellaceae bacterium]
MSKIYITMPDTKPYYLTIFFHQSDFSVLVFDKDKQLISSKKTSIDLLHTTEDELVRIMAQEPEIQQDYQKVRIVCESANYAFVPKEIFRPDDMEIFLNFQGKKSESTPLFNLIEEKSVVNVFSLPENLSRSLSRFYEQPKVEHHLTYLLNDFAHNGKTQAVFLWLHPDYFDLVVCSDKRLEFANSFNISTKEDLLYFTLLVFEQLSLDIHNTEITVLNAENQQDTINLLRQYIKKIVVK